jgi:hypothetical protein
VEVGAGRELIRLSRVSRSIPGDLEKYTFLAGLKSRNENVFYSLVGSNMKECCVRCLLPPHPASTNSFFPRVSIQPLIYTPVIGTTLPSPRPHRDLTTIPTTRPRMPELLPNPPSSRHPRQARLSPVSLRARPAQPRPNPLRAQDSAPEGGDGDCRRHRWIPCAGVGRSRSRRNGNQYGKAEFVCCRWGSQPEGGEFRRSCSSRARTLTWSPGALAKRRPFPSFLTLEPTTRSSWPILSTLECVNAACRTLSAR